MSHSHHDHPERELPEFSIMQQVKRRFFAMRNGMLADQIRRSGLGYRVNFGLNIPQLKEIATDIINSGISSAGLLELANSLWANINTRESRLMAPMIFPADIMSRELAARWLSEAQTTEVADHLCHSLLKRLTFAEEIALEQFHTPEGTPMQRYAALRLLLNLVVTGKTDPAALRPIAETAMQEELTRPVAHQLLQEIEFLTEE